MRIAVTLVIDMTDEQVKQYADEYGLPAKGGTLYAREVVEDVRSYVLTCIQDSAAFGETRRRQRHPRRRGDHQALEEPPRRQPPARRAHHHSTPTRGQ